MKQEKKYRYYEDVFELPFENYFRVINTGNLTYLYEFKQNNRNSELDINDIPVNYPSSFKALWEKMQYQFEEVEFTDIFHDWIQLTLNLIKLAQLGDQPASKLKVETSRLMEKISDHSKDEKKIINIGELATNIDSVFDFKKNILAQRFTMPIAEFKSLQKLATDIINERKKQREQT